MNFLNDKKKKVKELFFVTFFYCCRIEYTCSIKKVNIDIYLLYWTIFYLAMSQQTVDK